MVNIDLGLGYNCCFPLVAIAMIVVVRVVFYLCILISSPIVGSAVPIVGWRGSYVVVQLVIFQTANLR